VSGDGVRDGGEARREEEPGEAGAREVPRPAGLVWKSISIALGSILLLIGIAGLVLPGVQGILTILAGLALLSPHSRWAHGIMQWVKGLIRRARHRGPGGPGEAGGA
jgi:hypothetical protein